MPKAMQKIKTISPEYVTIVKSAFSFKIENFMGRPDLIKTAKIKIPKVDSVWWINIYNNKSNDYYHRTTYFEFCLEANHEEFWKSKIYSYNVAVSSGATPLISSGYKCIDAKIVTCKPDCYSEFASYLDQDGALSLDVVVTIECELSPFKKSNFHDSIDIREQAADTLDVILSNALFSDFTFKVKEKEFKVHRNILAAVSPVFKKMFEAKMKESISNQCEVDKIEPNVFEHLIRFIYGGNLPTNLKEVAMELYEAAHYYEIEGLKGICKNEVYSELSTANALEIYNWAYLYEMEDLKSDSWNILKRDVLEIFFPLKNEPLTPEMIQTIIKQKQNEEKFWKELSGEKETENE